MVVPEGQVFRADFSQSSGVERCFLAGSSSELWKRHRKLGYLSFDLLSRLSELNFEGPIRRPERGGGSEWEPKKILLEGD
jgi:hypothetical protein